MKEKKIKLCEVLCRKQIRIQYSRWIRCPPPWQRTRRLHLYSGSQRRATPEWFLTTDVTRVYSENGVAVTRSEEHTYDKNEAEILNEILTKNTWIGDKIDSIFKFTNNKTYFHAEQPSQGLLGFSLGIPPADIQETYIHIKCCMKCYCLEDHTTRKCSKHREYMICSKCSNEGHVWHQCLEDKKNALIVTIITMFIHSYDSV